MTRRKTIAEARDNLARLVHEVEDGEPVEITRRGRPVAVLLSLAALERLRSGRADFWSALTDYRKAHELAELTLDEALEDLRDRSAGRPVGL